MNHSKSVFTHFIAFLIGGFIFSQLQLVPAFLGLSGFVHQREIQRLRGEALALLNENLEVEAVRVFRHLLDLDRTEIAAVSGLNGIAKRLEECEAKK